jgi:hypothetical protein
MTRGFDHQLERRVDNRSRLLGVEILADLRDRNEEPNVAQLVAFSPTQGL